MAHEPSEQGRTKRAYVRRPDGKPQSRAELKRRHRANKAAREGRVRDPRRCKDGKPHDAHVTDWRLHLAEARAIQRRLCDAHVKRYRQMNKDRAKSMSIYWRNPDYKRNYQRERKKAMTDSYVCQQLMAQGFSREAIDAHILNLKREVMGLRRLSREIKQAVASLPKDEHETISNHP